MDSLNCLNSLRCLNKEALILLHKNSLLKTLVKVELMRDRLSQININEADKEKATKKLKESLEISNDEDYQNWLNKSLFSKKDFEQLALNKLRLKEYCQTNFDHKVGQRFLERKKQLDIVVYSMIRSQDANIIRELYLRIIEEEASFGDLASDFSEGPEKNTRGIIGPCPLQAAHPKLVDCLIKSKPGEVLPPLTIEGSYVIIRLESMEPAKLDNSMKSKMGEELFNNLLETETSNLIEIMVKEANENSIDDEVV